MGQSLRCQFLLASPLAISYTLAAILMYVIVDIAGFQEKVAKGDSLKVPLQDQKTGAKLLFDKVLLVSDGKSMTVGSPYVPGASVEGKVIAHGRYDKIRVVKATRRKRYRRVKGHKQNYTEIEVTGIQVS